MNNAVKNITIKVKREFVNPLLVKNKQKIFCIGRNKTGTTSLKKAMEDLGYIISWQRKAELLIDHYIKRDFKPIIKYCRTAQFFQDAPFSWPYTFIAMDVAFPNSKFILTIRDNADQWYNSLINYHSKLLNLITIPCKSDLKNAAYCYKGWLWKANQAVYHTPENEPYKKDILIKNYEDHNALVKEYFKHRTSDLLVLNLSEKDSYFKLCAFLDKQPAYDKMPWKNKT